MKNTKIFFINVLNHNHRILFVVSLIFFVFSILYLPQSFAENYASSLVDISSPFSSQPDDKKNNEKKIYLDYAASWEINEESLAEFIKISRLLGNSSGINSHAHFLAELEQKSAQIIADKIHAGPYQIHFTSGASASNNIAILGVAYRYPKCHLITSKIEHKSVLNIFNYLETKGYKVTYLNVDKYGKIDLKQLENSIQKDTKLISIQMFNSEIGTVQDVKTIGKIARAHNIIFHTDAAQSFCKYDIDVNEMCIDLLTISGHKIGAPKGIGALYVGNNIEQLQPIMFGSGDELFPGTKSTPLICAFAKAVEVFKFDKEKIIKNYNAFVEELSRIEKVYINSSSPSHVVSISIDGILLDNLLAKMQNYSFSSGCSCSAHGSSNVIQAIDPENKIPNVTIRVSFSDETSESELIDFAKSLKTAIEDLRNEMKVKENCEKNDKKELKKLNKNLKEIEKELKQD